MGMRRFSLFRAVVADGRDVGVKSPESVTIHRPLTRLSVHTIKILNPGRILTA